MFKRSFLTTAIIAIPLAQCGTASAQTATKKPNIFVFKADDVGIWNVHACSLLAE